MKDEKNKREAVLLSPGEFSIEAIEKARALMEDLDGEDEHFNRLAKATEGISLYSGGEITLPKDFTNIN